MRNKWYRYLNFFSPRSQRFCLRNWIFYNVGNFGKNDGGAEFFREETTSSSFNQSFVFTKNGMAQITHMESGHLVTYLPHVKLSVHYSVKKVIDNVVNIRSVIEA